MTRLYLKHRAIPGLLALTLSLLVVGCKSEPTPEPKPAARTAAELETRPAAAAEPKVEAEADVPYTLTLEPFKIEGLIGVHSGAHAEYDNKLVLLAGRKNGMHAFPPQRGEGAEIWSFPPDQANDSIYVVDLAGRRLLGAAAVDSLPKAIANQLRSVGPQFFDEDGKLYVVGGYAPTDDGSSMQTLDQVVAIDLPALIEAVTSGTKLDAKFVKEHIAVGNHPALAVTGGAIGVLGEHLLLAFGHMYNGLYTTGGGGAQQEYSQSVRELDFAINAGKVVVTYIGKAPNPPSTSPQPLPDGPYHRRDYTLLPVLASDGSPRIGAFGGVFKGGRMEGYVNPVYIAAEAGAGEGASAGKLSFKLSEEADSSQLLSQYETAVIPVYSTRRKAMYTTFFGGISQFHWDPTARKLVQDPPDFGKDPPQDGLPFINSISTLRVGGPGNGDFIHLNEQFPPLGGQPTCHGSVDALAEFGGTNAIFVMAAGLPVDNEVILLDKLAAPTVIGHVLGGIAATSPYPGKATCASDKLYAVTLTPNQSTTTAPLSAPEP